jgi:hypothetical protein
MILAAAFAAQGTIHVPGSPPVAQPVAPAPKHPDGDDSPEEIAKDAERDLKDSRFYNKPGATRAQYDADWQECRMIARGSLNPNGRAPTTHYYNPGVLSPVAAGLAGAAGGLIGGLIAAEIEKGQMRRANRRSCLLIKGWRRVEVGEAEAKRIAAMAEPERNRHFEKVLGATEVKGEIETWDNSFAAPQLAADPDQ